MDGRPGRRLSDAAVIVAIATLAGGCLWDRGPKPEPLPEPQSVICSIDPPPVLTQEEVAATPRPLKRWTAGVKKTLKDSGC